MRSARTWLRLSIVLAAVGLGWLLRAVTVPLLGAYLLCLVLGPLAARLKLRLGRTLSILLALAVLVIGPVLLLAPTLLDLDDFSRLLPSADEAAALTRRLEARFEELRAALPESVAASLAPDPERLQAGLESLAAQAAGLGRATADFLGGFFGILSSLILLPIFTFFLLQGIPWEPRLRAELPPEWRASYDRVVPRIVEIMRRYCTARVLVAAAKGAIWFVLLLIGGVPAAYTLALAAGALSLLPVFGPLLAFLGVALISFADAGLGGLAFVAAAYVVAELIEGYVLMPRLVGRGIGLGDFAVILAVMAGGTLGGIFGMLIAIPLMAIGKVLYTEFARPLMTTSVVAKAGR